MKKLGNILLWIAMIFVVGAIVDLIGLTQYIPKTFSFGVTPIGYLRFAAVLTLINIAISLREKK